MIYKILAKIYYSSLYARVFFWKILGVKIGTGSSLGKWVLIANPKKVWIWENCRIWQLVTLEWSNTEYGLLIGNNVWINRFSWIAGSESIKIEDNVQIWPNVTILSSDHLYSREQLIREQGYKSWPILLENDCWIGANSIILPWITVGKWAVVWANAVVSKDVEPYTIVWGIPAKFIKIRN